MIPTDSSPVLTWRISFFLPYGRHDTQGDNLTTTLNEGNNFMPAIPSNNALRLPNLVIRGFRGIEDLTIPRLGRVTLFAGKNGVGKTTLLDAVRLYAACGRGYIFTDILRSREELIDTRDEDGDEVSLPNWEALFYGRHISKNPLISIGTGNNAQHLSVTIALLNEKEAERLGKSLPDKYFSEEDLPVLRIKFQGKAPKIYVRDSGLLHQLLGIESEKALHSHPAEIALSNKRTLRNIV